jgi:hypothetical protein
MGLEDRIHDWNARGSTFKWFAILAVLAAILGAQFGVPLLLSLRFELSLEWSAYPKASFAVAAMAAVAFLFATANVWLRAAGFREVLDVTPKIGRPGSARAIVVTSALGLLAVSIGINIGKTIFT